MSVLADFQVNGLNPSVIGGTGVAIKYFPRLLGSAIGVQSVAPSATSAAGQLVPPAFNELNGRTFKVQAAGTVLPFTGGGTYTVSLQANTGTVASPSYTTIASTGAITLASATPVNFMLDVTLMGNTAVGKLDGYYQGSTNGALAVTGGTAQREIDAALSGLNFGTGLTSSGNQGVPFGLVVGVTFSVSLAQNSASLYQFQVIDF